MAPPAKPEPLKPAPRARPTPIRPQQFLWAYPAEPPYEDEARPMRNAPAVDSQGRIILYAQWRLVALAEEEGKAKVVWEYVTGSHVPGRIVVGPDDTIRAHTSDGFLHCLTPAGKQAWSPAQVGEPLGWAAPVVDESGNTWISAYDGGLLRVSPEGKTDRRRFYRTRSKLDSAAVVHGGVLYVGSEDGYVFAIQIGGEKGVSLWNHAAEQGYTGSFVNSSPAVADDGVLVVAARDEMLWGFAPSGAAAWNVQVPGQVLGSPVIDRHGHVYLGVCQAERGREPTGSLVCVDGNSHKIRWEYAAAGPVESTPVIGDDDVIYFGDNSGTLHALDARGTALWTAKVESPIRSAGTIPAPERLAFGLDNGTLVVLRCSSKALAQAGWPKIGRTLGQPGSS